MWLKARRFAMWWRDVAFTIVGLYGRKSFSQEGEDMVLRRIFEGVSVGFYVDVGAHHPKRFSNTYFFYRRGWRGVNIDAAPGSMRRFRVWRRRDINREIAVGSEKGIRSFYTFREPAFNGFSQRDAGAPGLEGGDEPISTIDVPVDTLTSILDKVIPVGTGIDFLTVDVEGHELAVLSSLDWQRYRPSVIVIEMLNTHITDLASSTLVAFLGRRNYRPFAKTVHSVFFVEQAFGEHHPAISL